MNNSKKLNIPYILMFFICGFLLLPDLTVCSEAYDSARVCFNGTVCEERAVLIDSVSYLPLRYVCENLADCSVEWDAQKRTAVICDGEISFLISENSEYTCINGRCFYIKDKIRNFGGRLYLPSRLLAKIFAMPVDWNSTSRTVQLNSAKTGLEPSDDYYNANDLYWLSHIIYAESGAEPLEGQIAVGNVVLNRVADKNYPNNIYDVIFDTKYGVQFEPVANGTVYNEPSEQAVIAAKICLEGENTAQNSIYFLNEQIAQSKWIVENRAFVIKIGNHTFYC